MTLVGNQGPCPRCGTWSPVVDGEFDFDAEGRLSIRRAPGWSRRALVDAIRATDWTPATVSQTVKAAKRAKAIAEKGDPRDAIHELAKSNQALGEALQAMAEHQPAAVGWNKSDVIALLALLLTALSFLYTVVTDKEELSEDDVVQVVEQTLHKQGAPPPPTTEPPASQ